MTVHPQVPLVSGTALSEALAMPDQDLAAGFRDPAAPAIRPEPSVATTRAFVFGVAIATTVGLATAFLNWFLSDARLTSVELVLTGVSCFTFFWVAMSVATALLGLIYRPENVPAAPEGAGLDVAILLPLFGEDADRSVGNAARLLGQLAHQPTAHRFSLHVLSDTRGDGAPVSERAAVEAARHALPAAAIHYRWRPLNTDFKPGNIREWVSREGAGHDAALVLDADSVMAPESVLTLADALAARPDVGLVQSIPRLIGGRTLFQRLQQFGNEVSGRNLGFGLSLWTGNEANYWGHNAMLRVRAFAATAGLPRLPGKRPFGGTILSHDFVEAALLRRAGWSVRFLPEAGGSFEETPETVPAYVRRDRRWCQGNMQHLRLLGVAGLHRLSRFHLLQGAMAYLASMGWFLVLMLWALVGDETSAGILSYFSPENPIYPSWPEMESVTRAVIVAFIYGMLVAPKLIGALARWYADPRLTGFGGRRVFAAGVLVELTLSVLLAPMMMVQHVQAVLRTLVGIDTGWTPKGRAAGRVLALVRFHAIETIMGLIMVTSAAAGHLSLWLLPIAICLLIAVPLSLLLTLDASRWPLFATPQDAGPDPAVSRKPGRARLISALRA